MDPFELFEYQVWADTRTFRFLDPVSEKEMREDIGDYHTSGIGYYI